MIQDNPFDPFGHHKGPIKLQKLGRIICRHGIPQHACTMEHCKAEWQVRVDAALGYKPTNHP